MRSSWKTLVVAAATLLVAPQLASANDEVEDQLLKMQQRLELLEDQLQATNDQLESSQSQVERQQEMIDKAGLGDDRSGGSALSRFLEQTKFGGHVSASYTWNFQYPDATTVALGNVVGGTNTGAVGLTAPYHPDHNTFQVDQVWFSAKKEATEESRGGFGFQGLYGKTADRLGLVGPLQRVVSGGCAAIGATCQPSFYNAGNANSFYLYEGYAEYLAPIWNGIRFKAGRFETPIGYETIKDSENVMITRGILWSLQPVSHTGVEMTVKITDSIDLMMGVANDSQADNNFETDNSKAFLGSLSYAGETLNASLNAYLGGDALGLPFVIPDAVGAIGANGGQSGLAGIGRNGDFRSNLNVVVTWDPSDKLHLWLDGMHIWYNNEGVPNADPHIGGVSVGGRYGITDRLGIAIRPEWIILNNFDRGAGAIPGNFGLLGLGKGDYEQFALTGTIDFALTEQLLIRAEGRWDQAWVEGGRNRNTFITDKSGDRLLNQGTFYNESDQVLGLLQLMYEF